MLVGIHKVVVCRVVQENETEPNGPASDSRTKPVDPRIRCPGENKQSNRNKPAGKHHWNKARFSRGLSVVLLTELEVVLVDKWSTHGTHDNANSEGDEHETSRSGVPSLAILVNDRVAGNKY